MSRRGFVARGAAAAGAAALAGPGVAFGRRNGVADLIVRNGSVVAVDPSVPAAAAVAVTGGLITAVGSDAEVMAYAGPGTEVVDARGGTVMPGIHDGHSHPFSGGQLLTAPSLNYAILDIPKFLKRIGKLLAKSAGQEPDGWLNVSLWDA